MSLCKQGVAELTETTALPIMQLLPTDLQTPPTPDSSMASFTREAEREPAAPPPRFISGRNRASPREVKSCHFKEAQKQTNQQLFQIWKLLQATPYCVLGWNANGRCQKSKLSGIGR